jgi:hypothetical protein
MQAQMVYRERTKLLAEAITKCYRQTGVNHLQLCRPLVIEYLQRLQVQEKNYPFDWSKLEVRPAHST